MFGDAGDDKLSGGDGFDRLLGGGGPDVLNGGNYRDYLYNGPGNDKVFGGPDASPDELYLAFADAGGHDLFDGGKGSDVYVLGDERFRNWGHATISDSDANPAPDQSVSSGDSISTSSGFPKDLTITLSPGPGPEVTDTQGTNTVEWSVPGEFYRVYGGSGDDTITGDGWRNVLFGGAGTNTMNGGGGNDNVIAEDNGGSLGGGAGNDFLDGYRDATLRGGDGNDHLLVEGDTRYGLPPDPTSNVGGGTSNDTIEALNGSPDTIDCGEGTDTVTFDAGMDTVTNCEP